MAQFSVEIRHPPGSVLDEKQHILFILQSYTGFSMAWATPDMIATIIGLITPVLVWAIPNKKVA